MLRFRVLAEDSFQRVLFLFTMFGRARAKPKETEETKEVCEIREVREVRECHLKLPKFSKFPK